MSSIWRSSLHYKSTEASQNQAIELPSESLPHGRLGFLYESLKFERTAAQFASGFEFIYSDDMVVGRGATFIALRQGTHEFTTDRVVSDGNRHELNNQVLVFKRARLCSPEDNWKSLILELRVLSIRPVQAHPNIVQLLGVGWDVISPVLVTECATHGTLASLERQNLRENTRLRLCHDVARALHFLHACSITHGDVKSENVLVFKHPQRLVIAKLGDFDCCVLELENRSRLPGGTEPWNAPEWRDTIEKGLLCKTDIYSFGLLCWRTLIGSNPFDSKVMDLPQTPAARFKAIQELKLQGAILPLALQSVSPSIHAEGTFSVLRNTLGRNGSDRDLIPVLAAFLQMEILANDIQSESAVSTYTEHGDLISWVQQYSSHLPSQYLLPSRCSVEPDQLCRLAYPLRKLVLDDLHRIASEAKDNADTFFLLFATTLILAQSPAEDSRAFAFLVNAARHGSANAEQVLYRFAQGLHQEIPSDIDAHAILKNSMLRGSVVASEDLRNLDPSLHATTLHEIRCNYGRVDTPVFDEVKSMFTSAALDALINSKNGQVDDVGVETSADKQEQGLLHIAAGCGMHDIVVRLLTHYHASVDKRNSRDETALLVACRSGNVAITQFLMDHGASVSIASASGETPLHWLCSFDDQDISDLASKMCALGANIDARAEMLVHSPLLYGGCTALDLAVARMSGTAVHALLRLGATVSDSSLATACVWLSTDILRALLEARFTRSGPTNRKLIGQKLLRDLIRHGSRFTLIERQGPRYRDALEETIRVLCTHGVDCSEIGDDGISALFFAVSFNRLDIVKCLIKPEFLHDINQARSSDHRTALHEAVAICSVQIFELLLQNDADFKQLWGPWNALHLCAKSRDDTAIQLASRLLSLGLEVDLTTEGYETPFHAAVICKSYALADFLLSKGARLNATFSQAYRLRMEASCTLLGYLVRANFEGNIESLQYILKHLRPHCQEDVMACPSQSWTILHVVASVPKEHRDDETNHIMLTCLMEWFEDHGASIVNHQDTDKQTALHIAVWSANVNAVKQLLIAGADPHILDKLGRSPRGVARSLRHQVPRTAELASYSAQWIVIDDMIEDYALESNQQGNNTDNLAEKVGALDIDIFHLKPRHFSFPYVNDDPTSLVKTSTVVSQNQISRTRVLLLRVLPTNVTQTVMGLAELDKIHVLTSRNHGIEVRANSGAKVENLYLISAPITGEPLISLVISTSSRDQGFTSTAEHHGTYDHSSSWFEVGILRCGTEFGQRYRVQSNLHGVSTFVAHRNVWNADHPFVACVQRGDRIGLWVVAQYPAWANIVAAAGIVTYTNPAQ